MKWLSLALDIAVFVYNHVTGKGKRDLDQELSIAQKTIKLMGSQMEPEVVGQYVEQAISGLKSVQDFKKRAVKKLDKAKSRLYKKLF